MALEPSLFEGIGLGRELDERIFVTSHFGERLGERNNVVGAYT